MNQYQRIVIFWGYTAAFLLNLLWICLRQQFDITQQAMIVIFTVILYATSSFFLVASCRKAERRRRLLYRCWLILFFYYIFVLVAILFLDGFFFVRHGAGAVNFIPFRSIHNYWKVYLRDAGNFIIGANLFGNFILFAPMGFFLPLLFPTLRRWRRFLAVILLFTVGTEAIQYLTHSGSTDIDDVILNVAGAFFVYFLVRLILRPGVSKSK